MCFKILTHSHKSVNFGPDHPPLLLLAIMSWVLAQHSLRWALVSSLWVRLSRVLRTGRGGSHQPHQWVCVLGCHLPHGRLSGCFTSLCACSPSMSLLALPEGHEGAEQSFVKSLWHLGVEGAMSLWDITSSFPSLSTSSWFSSSKRRSLSLRMSCGTQVAAETNCSRRSVTCHAAISTSLLAWEGLEFTRTPTPTAKPQAGRWRLTLSKCHGPQMVTVVDSCTCEAFRGHVEEHEVFNCHVFS